MNQPSGEVQPANWEITAVALQCHYIGDLITIRVNQDWVAECAWCLNYKLNAFKKGKQQIDKTIRERIDKCVGPDCSIVTEYRDKLIQEEFGRK